MNRPRTAFKAGVALFLFGGAIALARDPHSTGVLAQHPSPGRAEPASNRELGARGVGSRDARGSTPLATHRLAHLNWTRVRELVPSEFDTVLIPVGSMEAHGVLNNGSDSLVVGELADRLAPRVQALVAPTIPYSVRSSFGLYPGSLQVSSEAFRTFVREVVWALAEEGFDNLILLNGHAPSRGILDELAQEVSTDMKVRTLVLDWWTCCEAVSRSVLGSAGGHAGVEETALVLSLRPDLVRDDLAEMGAHPVAEDRGWSASPVPGPIVSSELLTPEFAFDVDRSRVYLNGVVDRMTSVILSVFRAWNRSGL